MAKRKDARGGKRIGAGRKPRDGSKRVPLNTRVSAVTMERIRDEADGGGLGLAIDRNVEREYTR